MFEVSRKIWLKILSRLKMCFFRGIHELWISNDNFLNFCNTSVGNLDKFLEHLPEQSEFLQEQLKSENQIISLCRETIELRKRL